MKNREKFWDETMGKLDERLIDRASEELKNEDDSEDEYYGARVEKIPVSSKRAIPFAPIIASAAAVCLIVGGVFLVRNMPIGVAKPSEGSETTISDGIVITTAPDITLESTTAAVTEAEDKGEIVGQVIWGSASEEEMNLELYEYYFFGEWEIKDVGEVFSLNYYEDFISSKCDFIGFDETDTEVRLYFSALDKKYNCIISKSNTNIMYMYSTDSGSQDNNIYQSDLIYTCYRISAGTEEEKNFIDSAAAESVTLGYFGRVKLLQYLTSMETVGRNYGESALYALTSKPLYNEETGYYKSEFVRNKTDKNRFFMLYTRDKENLLITVPYSPLYGGEALNMSIDISLENGEWVITDVRGNDKRIYSIVGESDEVISAEKIQEIADHTGSFDFGLLERSFYGYWDIAQNNTGLSDKLEITYNSDFFIRGYVRPSCFYEDENCYYLLYMGGGMGQLLLIDKSNPDIMYSYTDIEMMDIPRDSGAVYIRNKGVDNALALQEGEAVSFLGLMKFIDDYGFDLSAEDSFTDDEGYTWIHGEAAWGEGYGDIYLNELNDNMVVFSKRYYREDLVQEAIAKREHSILYDKSVYQYYRITAEKQNGEYTTVSRERYAEELLKDREKMSTKWLTLADEDTEKVNALLTEEGYGELSATAIVTDFYTDLSGHYYALREMGNNMAQSLDYCELYYYSGEGNGYRLLGDGMCGNCKAYISGDRLFLFGVYRDKGDGENGWPAFLKVYRDGEMIFSEEFGRTTPLMVTSIEIGDFIVFSYPFDMESADGEKIVSNRNILVNRYDSNVNYVTVDDIAVDIADGVYNFKPDYDKEERKYKGFTIKLDGEEYCYRTDSESLEDCLYELEWLYNDIYNGLCCGFNEGTGYITVNGEIYTELMDFKSHEELSDYLGRVFTEEAVQGITSEFCSGFYFYEGKGYIDINGSESSKRRVKLSVKSVDGNEAIVNIVILSDSENDRESPTISTAEVEAVKTEKGWRLKGYIINR